MKVRIRNPHKALVYAIAILCPPVGKKMQLIRLIGPLLGRPQDAFWNPAWPRLDLSCPKGFHDAQPPMFAVLPGSLYGRGPGRLLRRLQPAV